ncbi:MAG: carboxypeptidase-like regulatory domain-containing protein [Owenweeksia sp.]|nr:carboxypeptidase-like regulatory domain-containing protein [Owenweeksia sp.]
MNRWRFLILVILCGYTAVAQLRLEGWVISSDTEEPLPYAHVLVKGTEEGTITNETGYFNLSVEALPVVIVVSGRWRTRAGL